MIFHETGDCFSFQLEKKNVAQCCIVHVELKSIGKKTFKGFLLEARNVFGNNIVGSFQNINNDTKYIKCGPNLKSAVTNEKKLGLKKTIKVKWRAPSIFSGRIKFFGQVFKEKKISRVHSKMLEITSFGDTE